MYNKTKGISYRFLLFFLLTIISLILVFYTGGIQAKGHVFFYNKAMCSEGDNGNENSSKERVENKIKHRSPHLSVITNKVEVDMDEKSGDISSVYLKNYLVPIEDYTLLKKKKISLPILFSNDCKVNSVRSGIFGENIAYHLKEIHQSKGFFHRVFISFGGISKNGLYVEKQYTIFPDKYVIKSQMRCSNKSHRSISPLVYHEFYRSGSNRNITNNKYSYSGYSIYDKTDSYRRVPIKSINGMGNIGEFSKGWVADQEPGFLAAWIPKDSGGKSLYIRHVEPVYVLGYTNKQTTIKPGKSIVIKSDLYAGPVDSIDLFDARGNLENAYIKDPMSTPSRIALNLVQEINLLTNSWPLSIALSAFLVRTLLYPLAEISYISGFKMERVSLKIKEAQKKYGTNTDILSKKISSIYKNEGVNPISSLVVALVQSPVLLSLYSAIGNDIDFGKTSFLWTKDLSDLDPYLIMPFLVFLSTILQHVMYDIFISDSREKSKQISKYVVSLFLGISFLTLPVGLDIYWIATNLTSTLQQIYSFKKYSSFEKEKLHSKNIS